MKKVVVSLSEAQVAYSLKKMKKVSVSLNAEQIDLFVQMLEACHDLEDTDYNSDLIKLNEYLCKRRRAAWEQ